MDLKSLLLKDLTLFDLDSWYPFLVSIYPSHWDTRNAYAGGEILAVWCWAMLWVMIIGKVFWTYTFCKFQLLLLISHLLVIIFRYINGVTGKSRFHSSINGHTCITSTENWSKSSLNRISLPVNMQALCRSGFHETVLSSSIIKKYFLVGAVRVCSTLLLLPIAAGQWVDSFRSPLCSQSSALC